MNEKRMTLEDLKQLNTSIITNKLAAEVMGIDPGRLAEYARQGRLQWNTQIIGSRVYHSREDFIRHWTGELRTDVDLNGLVDSFTQAITALGACVEALNASMSAINEIVASVAALTT